MTLNSLFITAITIIISTTLWTCTSDKIACTNAWEFCAFVDNQDFDATGPLIDEFLKRLKKDNSEENLEKLAAWLACRDCVSHAEVLCNACIETNPPQSELRVDFISGGQSVTMTMDIFMDEPLRFNRYH